MTAALPFRLISEVSKRQISEAFLHVCQEWAEKWFLEKPAFDAEITSSHENLSISGEQWMIFSSSLDVWFAWKIDGAATREWLGLIFGSPLGVSIKSTPLMQDMLQECVTSLAQELAAAIGDSNFVQQQLNTPIKKGLRTGYGSGAIVVELFGGAQRQVIALGGGVIERWMKSSEQVQPDVKLLESRRSAVGTLKTALEVVAGHAELTLNDIVGLEVGDVIQIDTKLGEAFEIRAEGLHVATARLGVRGNQKAIQLIE